MHGKVEFNDQRLIQVIELVELAAERNAVKISASKKAKIIALFYQRMAGGDDISSKEVAALLKISA